MLKKILLFSFILCSYSIVSQTVSTITEGNFHDGLAVDSQGNVYGSDFPTSGSQSVYKYDTNGNVTVFATGFVSPNGIGINSQDEIYICDHFGNAIKKYDINGTLLANFNSGQFATPAGIKPIPNSLDMLVVEYNNTTGRKIKRLAADGTVTTLFSGAPLNGPAGIAFIGDVPYIANFNNRKIFRFLDGALTEVATLPSGGNPNSNFLGFLTSANGVLYATHIGLNSIYSINPNSGTVTLFAGSTQGTNDGDISTATFFSPNGIIADTANDKLYISDAGNKNLRIIDNAFLSTESFNSEDISITMFPNPAKDSLQINFKLKTEDNLKITITDMTGKSIYKKELVPTHIDGSITIPTAQWPKGTYIIQCIQNTKTLNKKIII